MKGKFIVIDGIDGSGKKTQTKAIVKKIRKEGRIVKTIDFPQYYSNFFGKLVSRYLSGELGSASEVSPFIASVLYAADRFESKKKIEKWLKKGHVVIADRYVSSNQIHQGGKIKNSKERKEFLKWLNKMEYGVFKIPKPDLIVYLNVSAEISETLLNNEDALGRKKYTPDMKDIHEADPKHLKMARSNALKLVKEENNWINIPCMEKGELLPINEITNKIWEELKLFIK